MKQSCRILGVFLCVLILSSMTFPVYASAAGSVIDTSTANEGYFTVTYHDGNSSKMKVGLVGSSGTKYLTYEPGEPATFSFPEDGSYTITLFKNVVGTSYRTVTSTQVTVKIQDELAPYLVSTDEITFSDDDVVGQVASKLCKDLQDTDDKVLAIHNYIASNFSYNNDFADAADGLDHKGDAATLCRCDKAAVFGFCQFSVLTGEDLPLDLQLLHPAVAAVDEGQEAAYRCQHGVDAGGCVLLHELLLALQYQLLGQRTVCPKDKESPHIPQIFLTGGDTLFLGDQMGFKGGQGV